MPGTGTTGLLSGAGQVHLVRTGGGAGPHWGAYAVLYTVRSLADGTRECVIAAAPPDQTDPALGLQTARPHGPTGCARKPMWEYAAASLPPKAKSESVLEYEQRLALFLLTGAHSARLTGPGQLTRWEMATEHLVPLHPLPGSTRGYAGYNAVRIGRLITVLPKEPRTTTAS